MKNSVKLLCNRNSLGLIFAIGALLVAGLACGSSKPAPSQYVGAWTGSDGTMLTIRADGSGDYKSGSSSVTNGSVTIDESAKTLKVTMAGMGPTYSIEKPPTASEMTLSGVVFSKGGISSTSTSSDSKTSKTSQEGQPEIPGGEKLQTLVKTTFLDFSDSVQSGDFTDFHKKVAKVWRDDSSADEMAEAFKAFVDDKENYDFKKAVSPIEAVFSPAPSIEKVSGLDALVVKGYYPTQPARANFDLKYTMDDGVWKLIGINVKTTKP